MAQYVTSLFSTRRLVNEFLSAIVPTIAFFPSAAEQKDPFCYTCCCCLATTPSLSCALPPPTISTSPLFRQLLGSFSPHPVEDNGQQRTRRQGGDVDVVSSQPIRVGGTYVIDEAASARVQKEANVTMQREEKTELDGMGVLVVGCRLVKDDDDTAAGLATGLL